MMKQWMRLATHRPAEAARRLLTLTGAALLAWFVSATPALADDRPDGSEMATAGSMMVVIVIFFVIAALGVWWSWNNGELTEPEEIKYEMLAMVEDEMDYWSTGAEDDDEDEEVPATPTRLISPAGTRR